MSGDVGGVCGRATLQGNDPAVETPQVLGIGPLPEEMFEKILLLLDRTSMKSTTLVNKHWKRVTIKVAARKEIFRIRDFANFVSENVADGLFGISERQREVLLKFGSDRKILDSVSLIEIKSSIVRLEKKISETLKRLEHASLAELEAKFENKNENFFFEDIFDLARDRLLNEAYSPKLFLLTICAELGQFGLVDKAITYASQIASANDEKLALCWIYRALADKGHFDKAIEVLNILSTDDEREKALKYVEEKQKEQSFKPREAF